MIGAVNAFTDKCVVGMQANREKAEGWLARNAILVTALNPIIGYAAGAALVKEALARNVTIREVAVEKAEPRRAAAPRHRRTGQRSEIETAWRDLRQLTEGGIAGVSAAGSFKRK